MLCLSFLSLISLNKILEFSFIFVHIILSEFIYLSLIEVLMVVTHTLTYISLI
jgi:hypothetical protein